MPLLPSTLEILICSKNKLISLPLLPSILKYLGCHTNQLTSLPLLPSTLEYLYCQNNQLTCLPLLPSALEELYCVNNQFMDFYITKGELTMSEYITKVRKQIAIINHFRYLFYALKYKKQFYKWLWVYVREPKIQKRYHPNNLITMLEGKEEISVDELDKLLEKW